MPEKEKRYCLRFNKNVFLIENNGEMACTCSLPKEDQKEDPCSVICVHNMNTQTIVNQLKQRKKLSDEDIATSLEPLGYRDWAPLKY